MTNGALRVGDADRLAAAEQLAAHTAAGRLSLAEHDQRVTAVWAARTRADLDTLFSDLPATLIRRAADRRSPAAATTAVSALGVVAVLAIWLAALTHPAWAASMMAACM